jgi:hypothetical protein
MKLAKRVNQKLTCFRRAPTARDLILDDRPCEAQSGASHRRAEGFL